MNIDGFTEYEERQFCRELPCEIQAEMDKHDEESEEYKRVRSLCNGSCLHTAKEFHKWLIKESFLILKPKQ